LVTCIYSGGSAVSQYTTSRKGGKAKSASAKVDSDDSTNYHISIPLSSTTTGSSNSNVSSSILFGTPPHFTPDHSTSLASSLPMSYQNFDNSNSSYNVTSGNRGYVNWDLATRTGSSSLTHFSGPHSPIASLAPHSAHTLPFTTHSRSSNEDVSIHTSSSLPYYYPPEWNRDDHELPEWNREWSRNNYVGNASIGDGMVPSSYSMDTTNPPPELSSSLLSSLDESLDLYRASGSQTDNNTTPSMSATTSLTRSLDRIPSTGDNRTNTDTVDSVLFGAIPTSSDREGGRMTHTRRNSMGQSRRQGVSYSADQHQSILQELLSTPPETSSASSYFSQRIDDHSYPNRIATVRLDQNDRVTTDVLNDDYPTRRRSARVCSGRSRLDVLQHRPIRPELAGASSSGLLESDNSPVLPLEDIAGILSDIEQNNSNSGRFHREVQSNNRGHTATEELSTPTTDYLPTSSQSVNTSEAADVITISSDEVCMFQ